MVGRSKASNLRHALFHNGYKRSVVLILRFLLLIFSLSLSLQLARSLRVSDFGIRDIRDRVAQPRKTWLFPFSSLRCIKFPFISACSSFFVRIHMYDFFNVQSFVLVNFYRLFGSRRYIFPFVVAPKLEIETYKQKKFQIVSSASPLSREKKNRNLSFEDKKDVSFVDQTIDKLKTDAGHFTRNGFEGDEFGFHRLLVTGHRNQMTQSNSDCISRHYLALINTYVLPLPLSSPPR